MPSRVLILRSDTLEQELQEILQDLGLLGQAVNIEVVDLAQSSKDYREGILAQANTKKVDEFVRVVLFVRQPRPSKARKLELRPDDLGVLTHLTEPSWMRRMILIQKGKANAADLWQVMNRRDREIRPKHVFGRPHGRHVDTKYFRQVSRAMLGRDDQAASRWMKRVLDWLAPWTKKQYAKFVAAAISALVAWGINAIIRFATP